MNTITLVILIIFISISSILFSQHNSSAGYYGGNHDSLLFDGSSSMATLPTGRGDDCKIMVTYVYGTAEGTFYKTDIFEICGQTDTSVITQKGKLQKNNVLKPGDEITTGDNSNLELQFWDGSIIRMGPNSKIKISGDMCDRRTYIEQISGKVWNSVKKLLGSQKYELKTNVYYSNVCVRGTEFSVEITSDEAIISVYESAVEVFPIVQNPVTSNDAKDFEQITKDYQAGKITIEEYMKKTQEFREKNDFDKLEKNMKSKMCNAGYMVKVTDKVSDPEPITPGSNWFDDVNFKK